MLHIYIFENKHVYINLNSTPLRVIGETEKSHSIRMQRRQTHKDYFYLGIFKSAFLFC